MTLRGFAVALTALSAVIWMGTSIFIPGLPEMGRDLGMQGTQLSNTLFVYCITFAVVMLTAGPLSDAWGRKKFILAGLGLFIIGSLSCAMAVGPLSLYTGRIIQGVGVGLIQVPTLAMVRDECSGAEAYTVLGLLGALTGIIPVISMLVGGVVIETFGWRIVFYILAGTASASIFVTLAMPETLAPEKRLAHVNVSGSLATYRSILVSRQILLVTSPLLLLGLYLGAYLIIAPIALAEQFNLSPAQFGVWNIMVVIGMAAGQFAATKAVKNHSPKILYVAGALSGLASGTLFAVLVGASAIHSVLAFMLPLSLFSFAFGFMEPIGLKSLFARFDETSGMASATYVSLLLVFQGSGSMAAGIMLDASFSSAMAMALVIAPLGIVITALAWAGKKQIL